MTEGRLLERGGILGSFLGSESVSESELLLGGPGGNQADFESLGIFSLGSSGVYFLEKRSAGSSDSLL